MDRMNVAVISFLLWVCLAVTGAYFLRDTISPMPMPARLMTPPVYPPPETTSGVRVESTTCAGTLAPSTSCTVQVRFLPVATGIKSSVYTFENTGTTPMVIQGVTAP